MKYKYRMTYEPQYPLGGVITGWYTIERKPIGFLSLFLPWEYVCLSASEEGAIEKCKRLNENTPINIIKEWEDE